jgi:hypothetical protein
MDLAGLYPQAPQQQQSLLGGQNPLQLLAGITELQQARQELNARQAIGNAYQKAMRPDGTIDLGAAQSQIASDPNAAFLAPQATNDLLSQRGQIIANATAQFQLGSSQNKFLMDMLGTYADKPDLNYNDVLNGVVSAARNSNIPSGVLIGTLSGMPQDPARLRDYLVNMRKAAIGSAGVSAPAPAVGYTGAGAPVPGTTGQFIERYAPGAGAGAPGSMPAPGSSLTPPPPGSEASTQTMQADLTRAGTYGQEIFPWQQALEKLQALGPGGTGPGSKGRQEFESFLYSLSPTISRWAGVDPSKLQNYAEAEKYLTQATQQRAAGFGAHTDMQLATAISGNPNVHINDLANTDVVKAAIALRRMEQAQTLESSRFGGPSYTTAKAQWAAQQDPRAFAIDMMSPPQIKNLQQTLKGPARDRFNASLRSAINNGLISPPGQ